MTLLESLIATVLLAVVAVACLEGTRGATRLQQRQEAMVAALARAESELAGQVAGASAFAGDADAPSVRRTPYGPPSSAARLELVAVEVSLPGGGTMRLMRLVERAH